MSRPIEKGWTRTGAPAETWLEHEWVAYRTGINQYARYCAKIDATVHHPGSYYTAQVGEKFIMSERTNRAHRFQTRANAYTAAIELAERIKADA